MPGTNLDYWITDPSPLDWLDTRIQFQSASDHDPIIYILTTGLYSDPFFLSLESEYGISYRDLRNPN